MKYEISDLELLQQKYLGISNEQGILSMLKEKGAPIDGTIYFKLRPGYSVTSYRSADQFTIVYIFTEDK